MAFLESRCGDDDWLIKIIRLSAAEISQALPVAYTSIEEKLNTAAKQADQKTVGPGDDNAKSGIIWLASYPKSGNTWTRSFLFNLIKLLSGEDPAVQDINAVSEVSIWDVSGKRYKELLGKTPKEAGKSAIAAARPRVQMAIADHLPGLSLVKTHNALVMDRGYPAINTNVTSGAVYIVRNPLDVAISFAHHLGSTIDDAINRMATEHSETDLTEESVHEIYGSWSQNVYSWTRKSNPAIFVMRYEDMTLRPEQTFGALACHLLMQPSKTQLKAAVELSAFNRLREQEDKNGFSMKPHTAKRFFRKGQVGEWRETLSDNQVRSIIDRHREQMLRFGYVPEEHRHRVR